MLNFCLYKPCAMSLSLLHFQPCAGSEPDCNCCLSLSKCTYMQLRSPEGTRVNFHLSVCVCVLEFMLTEHQYVKTLMLLVCLCVCVCVCLFVSVCGDVHVGVWTSVLV